MQHAPVDGQAHDSRAAAPTRRADAATIDALRAAIAAVPPGGSAPSRDREDGLRPTPDDDSRRAPEGRTKRRGAGRRHGGTGAPADHEGAGGRAPHDEHDAADEQGTDGTDGPAGRRDAGSERGGPRRPATVLEIEDAAREYLLRSLTAAARSRQQLASGLAKRDVPEDVAERLLDRFEEVGLVDDAALAQAIVRSRSQETGAARRRIASELRRKGFTDDVAHDALAQVDDEDERRSAYDLARVRARRLVSLDRDVALRRLVGFLGRKGYPPSLCLDAARAGLESAMDERSTVHHAQD
ncbi:regulatory protein RecX [Sanguibacter massiliensis]|uniref:regulatory protein RecX n=1 Tax=Sanguibacter massiliensis TaxID=1973217 RepID=UPI000C81C444|nr:regulatory protein RecX [Sanguibacter massiliensis]